MTPLDHTHAEEPSDAADSIPKTSQTNHWPDPVMNFLVAYDIGEPSRLRQVAKLLEQSARRVQKSLFVFTGTRLELDGLMSGLMREIDPISDRIQAWPVRTSSRSQRIDVGSGMPEMGVAVIVSPAQCLVIEAIDEPQSADHEPLVL